MGQQLSGYQTGRAGHQKSLRVLKTSLKTKTQSCLRKLFSLRRTGMMQTEQNFRVSTQLSQSKLPQSWPKSSLIPFKSTSTSLPLCSTFLMVLSLHSETHTSRLSSLWSHKHKLQMSQRHAGHQSRHAIKTVNQSTESRWRSEIRTKRNYFVSADF